MIFKVVIADGVEEELENIAMWIEEQRSGFGFKFMEAFDVAIEHLSKYPNSYSIKLKNYRTIKLGRFRYILVYKILGNTVLILRVIHTSRHPGKRYRK